MTISKMLIESDDLDNLLAKVDQRDVALWVLSLPSIEDDTIFKFLSLPWHLVVSEDSRPTLVRALEANISLSDPMVRKRGFVQIVDNDPSRIQLPERCLPFYLLNGREGEKTSEFEKRLRRMTMLEQLRRSGVKEIVVVAEAGNPIPQDLVDLWNSGFRSFVSFVAASKTAKEDVQRWLDGALGISSATLAIASPSEFISKFVERYLSEYPSDRQVVRIRDVQGKVRQLDLTEIDEPERPLLDRYYLVRERDLASLLPDELSERDFIEFFQNSQGSWKPYAAGLPWLRDTNPAKAISGILTRLDADGSDENLVAYISAESGAGGSTLARALAWECARSGYPVLVAKPLPFTPEALPVVNYLARAIATIAEATKIDEESRAHTSEETRVRRYEPPWLIVFDALHWQNRDAELLRFRNELTKAGRAACILTVTGPIRGLSFFNTAVFRQVAELNHVLDHEETHRLGRHLNKFLRVYGRERPSWQWDQFYEEHAIRHVEGYSAFWVTLSFWIRDKYDLSESIQDWVYKAFKSGTEDPLLQRSLLEIAALSSERVPMPEGLLPASPGSWPASVLLEDQRVHFAGIGLVKVSANGERYWALVHDVLGRFLINAFFYDIELREELGFGSIQDAESLRFELLRQISEKPTLGERQYLSVAEDFATTIFKIDPDHGLGTFASIWARVIDALEHMPRSVRDTSRVFRHHVAISRRRIAKLNGDLYGISNEDKLRLVGQAVDDITYALSNIEYSPGSESNLNLYNSLANAYFDWADLESAFGDDVARVGELRELGAEATRRAYAENPTNSFVIETYVKNLLQGAKADPGEALKKCVEALGVIFSALSADQVVYRTSQLNALGDDALSLLLALVPENVALAPVRSPLDVLVKAWVILGSAGPIEDGLMSIPSAIREQAIETLSGPIGRGNAQVSKLLYDLICIQYPYEFTRQVRLLDELRLTGYSMSPQLRLDHAILMYQTDRFLDAEKIFRSLRQLWRESEYFVYVPERLRWLRSEGGELRSVHAVTGSDHGARAVARVTEFAKTLVAFRPVEHGMNEFRPRTAFTCHVSFGHNGPFLRPLTARAS